MPGQMAAPAPAQPMMDDPQERMRGFLNMVQQIHQMIDATAEQHPEASAGSRGVKAAVERWIMDVVKSPLSAGSEPVPPRIVG